MSESGFTRFKDSLDYFKGGCCKNHRPSFNHINHSLRQSDLLRIIIHHLLLIIYYL
jgi:hypothetical protein